MTEAQKLLADLTTAADELGLSRRTISRLAGQGGGFPDRLEAGKRIWPETADKVRDTIAELRARAVAPRDGAAA